MSVLDQNVYLGRDNVTKLNFSYVDENGDESVIDLSPVTAADVIVHGANAGADVLIQSSSTTMTFDAQGNFGMYLGDVSMDIGRFYVSVIFYDVGHPDGQVVIHKEELNKLRFITVDVNA